MGQAGDDSNVLSLSLPPASHTSSLVLVKAGALCNHDAVLPGPPWTVCGDPHPRAGHSFPACTLKGDVWDILAGPKDAPVSLWLSSSPAQLCPTFCDVYSCCMESMCDVGLALNPSGSIVCWGEGYSLLLVTPRCFWGTMQLLEMLWVNTPPVFGQVRNPFSHLPCRLHRWRPQQCL